MLSGNLGVFWPQAEAVRLDADSEPPCGTSGGRITPGHGRRALCIPRACRVPLGSFGGPRLRGGVLILSDSTPLNPLLVGSPGEGGGSPRVNRQGSHFDEPSSAFSAGSGAGPAVLRSSSPWKGTPLSSSTDENVTGSGHGRRPEHQGSSGLFLVSGGPCGFLVLSSFSRAQGHAKHVAVPNNSRGREERRNERGVLRSACTT